MTRVPSIVIVIATFLMPIAHARAQIAPFHGTLAYSARDHVWPKLFVKAANGSRAYVVKLISSGDSHIELVLQRPNTKRDARNALEPDYRWHGLQEYDFNAIDFVDGPEKSIMGTTRHLHLRRRKLDVTFSVAKVKVHQVANSSDPSDYVFDELVIDVNVENAK